MHCNAPDGLCQNTDCKAIGCCQTYPTEPRLNKETKPCHTMLDMSPVARPNYSNQTRTPRSRRTVKSSTPLLAHSKPSEAQSLCETTAKVIPTVVVSEKPSALPSSTPTFKQTTRLLKCQCDICGYTVRVTRKWLDIGAPHCPDHGAMPI